MPFLKLCGGSSRQRPLANSALLPLLSIVVLIVLATIAHAQVEPRQTWDVWEASLGFEDFEFKLVATGLTQEEAEELAAKMTALHGKTYIPCLTAVDNMVDQMRPGKKRPSKQFDTIRDYLRAIEDAYARLRQFKEALTKRTTSITEEAFVKVNGQIDQYNQMRADFRDRTGFYPPNAPKLPRLQPGDVKVRATPVGKPPDPDPSTSPSKPYKPAPPYNVPPEFKDPFAQNPRLVLPERTGPMDDQNVGGIRMHVDSVAILQA